MAEGTTPTLLTPGTEDRFDARAQVYENGAVEVTFVDNLAVTEIKMPLHEAMKVVGKVNALTAEILVFLGKMAEEQAQTAEAQRHGLVLLDPNKRH